MDVEQIPMQELKILMLEDNLDDAGLVQRVLEKAGLQFTIQIADSKENYIAGLNEYRPDIVICDHGLPQFNSTEALTLFKASNLPAPFILVTGTVSEEFAVNFLKQGADDYILKSNLSRLPSAVKNALNQRQSELNRKQAEKKLERQNEILLETVERLERTNNELDNFLYSVSHNLRAPLTSVLGLISLSKLGIETDHNMLMSLMENSVKKLDTLLQDILSYSFNSKGEILYEAINLEEEFYLAVRRHQYFPGWNEIMFQCDSAAMPRQFYCDSFRVRLILSHVVMNAIQFRDENKKEKYCKLTIYTSEDSVTLSVRDNGVGIDPVHHEAIFKMFFKASNVSDGAGLGLYLVKEAARKLKGTVSIESAPNEGTTFNIVIPYRQI